MRKALEFDFQKCVNGKVIKNILDFIQVWVRAIYSSRW